MIKYVIASSKAPTDQEGAAELAKQLRDCAKENEFELIGIRGEEGPGCYNYGLFFADCEEPDFVENLVSEITMALMPARYTRCFDPDFTGTEFNGLK